MSDDFEGIPLDLPADVPADIQSDGAVTEIPTGEQVANEGGNPVWYDSTYPGQTTTSANSPTQDAYGLNILNAAETKQLTKNINPAFINSLVDPNTPIATAATNAVNTSASKLPVYVDPNGVVFDPVTGVSYPVDSAGKQIIPADVAASIDPAAQNRIGVFNGIPILSSTPVDPKTLEGYGVQAPVDPRTLEGFGVQAPVDPTTLEGYGVNEVGATPNPTTSASNVNPTTQEGYGVNEVGATPTPILTARSVATSDTGFVTATAATTATTAANTLSNAVTTPAAVNPTNTGFTPAATTTTAPLFGANPDAEAEAAAAAEVGRQLAQQQAVLNAQKRIPNNSDWRVRLSLAPNADYLYNAPTGPNGGGPGILWPLAQTGGVVFPYTPRIEMSYKADYESYALTHSNYKGYFYKSSYTDAVNMTATFTAQDTNEAQYLLAVIHFFRSVTKMFYGQDAQRGAPPPLVYLTGLGEYQFTRHPCVVTSFNYNLPGDVDYIRARSINVNGTDLLTRRNRQDLPTNPISGAVARLQNLFSSQGINKGALFYPPPIPNLGENQPTYVPTKMDITLSLLPVQTRSQVTNQFSLKDYSNGALLKGGFW